MNDVYQHFGRQQEELELMVALALLIAAEGELRRDYWTRVYERRKDELSRHFREIHKHRGKRVLLEQHILAGWRRLQALQRFPKFSESPLFMGHSTCFGLCMLCDGCRFHAESVAVSRRGHDESELYQGDAYDEG